MLKKQFFLLLFTYLTSSTCFAQFEANEIVYNGQIGYKLLSSLALSDNTIFENTKTVSSPAYHGTIDYGINNVISVGLAYGFQKSDLVFNSGENAANVVARIARVDLGIRTLVHYGNDNDLDLYSGVRLGYKMDDLYEGKAVAPSSSNSITTGDRPTIGIILFGLRYWPTTHFGLTTEIHWGRPYIANVGVATCF